MKKKKEQNWRDIDIINAFDYIDTPTKENVDIREKVTIYVNLNPLSRKGETIKETLERIKSICIDYCKSKNYKVYGFFYEGGKSAKYQNKFWPVLNIVRDKQLNKIITVKPESLTYQLKDIDLFLQKLKEYNCSVECIISNLDYGLKEISKDQSKND